MRAWIIALLVPLAGCNMEVLNDCLPEGESATVIRVREGGREVAGANRILVALKRPNGLVTTCAGGNQATMLAVGDRIDGKTLHTYSTRKITK